jgi:hypothetical protein
VQSSQHGRAVGWVCISRPFPRRQRCRIFHEFLLGLVWVPRLEGGEKALNIRQSFRCTAVIELY